MNEYRNLEVDEKGRVKCPFCNKKTEIKDNSINTCKNCGKQFKSRASTIAGETFGKYRSPIKENSMKIENKIEKFLNEDTLEDDNEGDITFSKEGKYEIPDDDDDNYDLLKVGDKVKIEKSYRTIPIDGPEWKQKIESLRGKVGNLVNIDKHGMAQVKFGSNTIKLHKGHIVKV